MTIQYASDLHLEFADNREFVERGGITPVGDILVLAGDISYLGDHKMMKRPFFDWCAEHFRQTYIVPGNHEFYHGYDIAQTMKYFEFAYRENVRYLNNKSVVEGDTELFFTWHHRPDRHCPKFRRRRRSSAYRHHRPWVSISLIGTIAPIDDNRSIIDSIDSE